MPQKTKSTVRIDSTALDRAKHSAAPQPARTPILDKLTGILPADAALEDHRAYLGKKYGVPRG